MDDIMTHQRSPMDHEHSDHHDKSWEMNYLEASIFLEEGENNDKFNSHPRDHTALPAYLITHNHWFYVLDLLASLVLLFLALMEPPALETFKHIPVGVHSSIELFSLTVLGISIGMQVRWLGSRTFVRHKRSLIKSLTWLIMVAEALAVLVRNSTHFRVTRALRPIFIVDSRYLGGVRRFLRQILQSLPPILEVLGLLLFTLVIFAVFGYYLFSSNPDDPYFSSFYLAIVSLYVLLTTANFPDVMMPSYAKNRWSSLFFIAYLCITLYFVMNLMLAIVFVEFSNIEKEKFRKLLLHKREACQHSFQLLVTHSHPNRITFRHFQGLMHFYKPKACRRNVYLLFKALNRSKTGVLTLKEFYGIYDALEFRWSVAKEKEPWFAQLWTPLRVLLELIRKLVLWKGFKIFVYLVIGFSAVILLFRTILLSSTDGVDVSCLKITWDQLTCIIFYVFEILLKLLGLGFDEFFSSGWNVFDFVVTLLSVGGVVGEYFNAAFYYIVILRPLRLLRLFKFRRRYKDIFQTLAILLPRILSTVIVIVIIYYFFAILGMELFSNYDMRNCCVNTTVEQFYKADNTTVFQNYYYLNNFDTLLVSGITLFELTVVNNWFIIMEGYASVSGETSRLFFMTFYLVMMVVLAIVVAFIIEAFTFRMCYNEAFKEDAKESENITINVVLTRDELDFIYYGEKSISGLQDYPSGVQTTGSVGFRGVRKRTKFVLQRRMYSELITSWLREHRESLSSDAYPLLRERRPSSSSSTIPSLHGGTSRSLDVPDDPSRTTDDHLTVPRSSFFESLIASQVTLEEFPSESPANQPVNIELPSPFHRPEVVIDDGEPLVGDDDDPFFPSHIQVPARVEEPS